MVDQQPRHPPHAHPPNPTARPTRTPSFPHGVSSPPCLPPAPCPSVLTEVAAARAFGRCHLCHLSLPAMDLPDRQHPRQRVRPRRRRRGRRPGCRCRGSRRRCGHRSRRAGLGNRARDQKDAVIGFSRLSSFFCTKREAKQYTQRYKHERTARAARANNGFFYWGLLGVNLSGGPAHLPELLVARIERVGAHLQVLGAQVRLDVAAGCPALHLEPHFEEDHEQEDRAVVGVPRNEVVDVGANALEA